MKTKIVRFLAVALLAMALVPSQGWAASVSAGAATFFSWWSPSFENGVTGKVGPQAPGSSMNRQFTMGPSFLVGPTVSVTLPAGFSVSSVFLWGSWFSGDSSSFNANYGYRTRYDFDVRKWDLDVLVNYALNRYLKLFGGIKYQGYRYHYTVANSMLSYTISADAIQGGWGPGIGASLTLNLWGPLYLMANASVMYLSTDHRFDAWFIQGSHSVYHTVGGNVAASLAWYIEPASVTVSLGFRYQYLHYMLNDGRSPEYSYSFGSFSPSFNNMNDDHFYGITLAAIYSLEL
jgi:hypothetical protein